MKNYIKADEWLIIEDGFHPEFNEMTESIMSLGNGRMGQRANFEECYSGQSLQGNYMAGVWFPDKTKVGWWKNGYPEYFAKVINATNWLGIDLIIDGIQLDLAKCKILSFRRTLDMKNGTFSRKCTVRLENGYEVEIDSLRFCSMDQDSIAAISYTIRPVNFSGKVKISPFLDGNVRNRDSNHGEQFWEEKTKSITDEEAYLTLKTKKSPWESVPRFSVCTGMKVNLFQGKRKLNLSPIHVIKDKFLAFTFELTLKKGEQTTVQKIISNKSSEIKNENGLSSKTKEKLDLAVSLGFETLLENHKTSWSEKWLQNDVEIKGDISAQQAIRFNIFQLQQTYTGEDASLNIGPKGFTGEKYGGVTYWDTEAYCLPFYLATAEKHVARNLVKYRYNHLQKAIDNASILGFTKGAALFPMVTMNGEECHNEWEITFEEIHRNGAIAYAIYDYVNYSGDKQYLVDYGLEVLIAISRFWAQRVNWSNAKNKYVMLGVTGPNEYENNVNNNWYTNYLAKWTLSYTLEVLNFVDGKGDSFKNSHFKESETTLWKDIINKIHLPYDEDKKVFLQQDGFLDKELKPASEIEEERPINQNWSWDRILRSCFIKQADVLQGMYFFEKDFSKEELQRNFDFYEPMTVHESSLSPCVHTILACRLGRINQAMDLYTRTARLDLDDYNNDTEDGLHITAMAGAWMALVKGFGGMKVENDAISFNPVLPKEWESYSFRVGFRGEIIKVFVDKEGVKETRS